MQLLGVEDVAATKRLYVDRGLTVARSFGARDLIGRAQARSYGLCVGIPEHRPD